MCATPDTFATGEPAIGAPDGKVIAPSQGPQRLCVLKTRFGNSGDEGRRERAHRAGWRDGSERLCWEAGPSL